MTLILKDQHFCWVPQKGETVGEGWQRGGCAKDVMREREQKQDASRERIEENRSCWLSLLGYSGHRGTALGLLGV